MRNTSGKQKTARFIRQVAALTLTVTLGVSVVACTESIAGRPTSQSTAAQSTNEDPTSAKTSQPSTGESTADTSKSRDGDPSAAAGDAPYDPCTVITWDDVPAQARPNPDALRPPAPREGTPDSDYKVGCLFAGEPVQIMVVWGHPDQMPVAPQGNQGEKPVEIGGKTALMRATLTDKLQDACVINIALGSDRGVAGVAAIAPRGGPLEAAPCNVVTQLAQLLVARTS